ncbi:hypothetical protein Spla01_06631 [Streptomyces platensis]|uniref:Uncharacterized protein n=1 Tax=Streptomyces platensis TaxID=58346 RepID=A0ABX3XLD4_STRPT|nr:hypothetical protein BG653_06995 [Streptomyces platensis]
MREQGKAVAGLWPISVAPPQELPDRPSVPRV